MSPGVAVTNQGWGMGLQAQSSQQEPPKCFIPDAQTLWKYFFLNFSRMGMYGLLF